MVLSTVARLEVERMTALLAPLSPEKCAEVVAQIHRDFVAAIHAIVEFRAGDRGGNAEKSPVTDEMVGRFLGWKLPLNFVPDCGVSFAPPDAPHWPTGTNLLSAEQARAMLEHVLGP